MDGRIRTFCVPALVLLFLSLGNLSAPCGHLETTLNVYTHAIPQSQRRAVDKIAEVLFTNVHKISAATENEKVN